MRILPRHFPDDALPTLDTFLTIDQRSLYLPLLPCASGSIALPAQARRIWWIALCKGRPRLAVLCDLVGEYALRRDRSRRPHRFVGG